MSGQKIHATVGHMGRLEFEPVTYQAAGPWDGDYRVTPARYAKGKVAVQCPSTTGYKTRAARLACALRGRYVNRERAYIMGRRTAERFLTLYHAGWDACAVTCELEAPRG